MTEVTAPDETEAPAEADLSALETFLPYLDEAGLKRWREKATPILLQADWYGAEYEDLKYQADHIVSSIVGYSAMPAALGGFWKMDATLSLGLDIPHPNGCAETLFGSVDKKLAAADKAIRKALVALDTIQLNRFYTQAQWEADKAILANGLAALPDWEARINSVRPLARRLAEIKAAKLKGPRPKPNAKPRKPEYKPSPADHKDVKRMWSLLEELTAEVRAKMVPVYVQYYTRLVDSYFDLREDETFGPQQVWKRDDSMRAITVDKLIDCGKTCGHPEDWYCGSSCSRRYSRADDQDARVLALAERDVDEYCAKFHARMTEKLAPIITAKQNLSALEKVFLNQASQTVEGRVHAEFADGSQFDIELQVIYNQSKYGRPFAQFPARFDNVRLASGNALEDISEETVHEVFVKGS